MRNPAALHERQRFKVQALTLTANIDSRLFVKHERTR
jgi:hypothetical protein